MKRWWYFASLVVAFFAASAVAETASQVFKQDSPSVVVIVTYGANGKAIELGSGVKLPDGAVATNCHVLKDGTTYKVRYRDKIYPATLAKSDWNRDVCTLTVPNLSAPPVVLGSTKNLQTGATVFAIGTPEGLQLTLSEGIVSSLRPVGGGSYIQTTAAVSPGSSGGGLFDDRGRLLGLTSFYVSNGQQLNFALPVEWIEALPYLPAQRAAQGTSEVDWMNRAAALETKGDWDGLLVLARRWAASSPESALARGILGEAYYHSGRHRRAIDAFHEALRINPRLESAWYNLGVAYGNSSQRMRAIDAYREALRINPLDEAAWYNLGIAYDDSDMYTQAIDAYRQALRITPTDQQAWINLGLAYSKSNQGTQAAEAYRRALRINPQETKAWFGLGIAYAIAGQRDQALAAYQHLETLSPKLADDLLTVLAAEFHARTKTDFEVQQKRTGSLRPSNATDIKAWQNYLTRVALANAGGISSENIYLYFVPASDVPGAAASIARVQHYLAEVVAATVVPNSMVGLGGPSSSTTAMVLENAFSNAAPGSFKGVVILFMGVKTDEAAVRSAVAPSGATFRFADIVGGH